MSVAKKDLIISLPNERLRQKSQRVGVITDGVRQIIDDMKQATLDWEASRQHEVGVALASIQIDKPLRIIIVRQDFDNKSNPNFNVFINPEIVKLEGQIEEDYEGCLSVSDIYGLVPRSSRVRVRATDENGHQIRFKADGFLARVLQHEVDHIHGVMFVDHIEDRPDAFYKLTKSGKLEEMPYDKVRESSIFR